MIGEAVRQEPGYLELRRLEVAKDIAHSVAKSPNRIYLDADSLLLNVLRVRPLTSLVFLSFLMLTAFVLVHNHAPSK